jgi:hypothetical protein
VPRRRTDETDLQKNCGATRIRPTKTNFVLFKNRRRVAALRIWQNINICIRPAVLENNQITKKIRATGVATVPAFVLEDLLDT